ncbi:MAG: FapA family protein [Clostridia bacterium]|nr:FapA family protein [Clostridia bacterium]
MKKTIKVSAKSYEQAVGKVLKQLNLNREDVDIELIKKTKGFLTQSSYEFEIGERQASQDGSYDIRFEDDGVYLIINPHKGAGKPINQNNLIKEIIEKRIDDIDKEILANAISSTQECREKIAPAQQEKKIDAKLSITIDKDAFTAYAEISPPLGGKMIEYDAVLQQLEQNGIVFGIKHENIKNFIKESKFNQRFIIANGIPPIDGQDGKVKYYFNKNKQLKPKELENGRVDYHELGLVENIKKGQCLAEITHASKGQDGTNVYGKNIKAKDGKNINIKLGKNVELEGNKIIATDNGQATIIKNMINVYRVYEVNGDVDNSTGNIDFIGNIIIKGNVLTGFEVKAGGNIDIFGAVEGAIIKAEGDIKIHRGVQGRNLGLINCGGNLVSSFVENARIVVRGKMKADAILHSHVYCNDVIELDGKRGIIVGGVVKALNGIKAKSIGSSMCTGTEIEVGCDPLLREEYNKMKEQLKVKKVEIAKAEKVISLLNKYERKAGLDNSKQDVKVKAIKSKLSLMNESIKLEDKISQTEQKIQNMTKGKVSVLKTIYPGVKIVIGKSVYEVKDEMKYSTFKNQDGDIKVLAYENI